MAKEITERGQQVLKALVEHYIEDGQPVGSKNLRESAELNCSPATVRNVMADLEDRGLIISPHTSAGRVPTVQGYRLFVDTLITMQPLGGQELGELQRGLRGGMSSEELVASASRLLSRISNQAGLVTLPRHDEVTLRQVEFLPLSEGRVLAILVCNEKEVQNRVLDPGRDFSEEELRRAANYINQHFSGQPLTTISAALLGSMQEDKDQLAKLMQSAIDLSSQAFNSGEEGGYVVAGESHLLDNGAANMQHLKGLFQAFEQKKDLLHLMDSCLDAQGTRIFIGEESGYSVLDDYSVITTPYQVSGDVVGVLGVIGPTRMSYERVIPLVDITSRLLSAALAKS
ncbi:MAG: heat-inducible transcriptional repressor HrcA [Pseudomonadales bacterium]